MSKKFNDMKLINKFLLLFLLVDIVTCIGILFVFQSMKKTYDKELYDKSMLLLTLFSGGVQSELDQVLYDSQSIVVDNDLQGALTSLKNSSRKSEEWLDAYQMTKKAIGNFEFYSENIRSVYLIGADGSSFGQLYSGVGLSEGQTNQLVEMAEKEQGRVAWISFPELQDSIVLTREIRQKKNMTLSNLGTLMIHINLEDIIARCNKPLVEKGASIQIAIYQDDTMIYASDHVLAEIMPDEDGYLIKDTEAGKLFCVYHTDPESGWTYITAIPYTDIYESVNRATERSVGILLLVMLITFFCSARVADAISRQIVKLIQQCDMFAKGVYVSQDEKYEGIFTQKDEIGKLYRHFDRMAAENKKMIHETYVKQQLLLESQVSNLRAQIRPHFIYNTLESIYCLAQSVEDDRIAIMTSSLGKLLRMSLKEQRNIVDLKEDLRIVEEYLKIQSIRLGNRLKVRIQVEDKYENVKITSMTLQPLVENAIFYSAEEMQEVCEICLYCREDGDFVEVVVEDNGPGMDEDIIQKLESSQIKANGLGIGLVNINKRLKLLISEDSGIKVERKCGRTLVIVRIRKREWEQNV